MNTDEYVYKWIENSKEHNAFFGDHHSNNGN